MNKNQKGFGVVEGLLILVIMGLIGFIGWYVWQSKNSVSSTYNNVAKTTNTVTTTGGNILVEIKDSGSTNFAGWDLQVFTDGSGKVNLVPSGSTTANPSISISGNKKFPIKTFTADSLKQSLDSTDLSSFANHCFRSASFGSTETLIYNGKTTNGIDCYMTTNPNNPLTTSLSSALKKAGLR